jgi:hypothetical protein
MHAHSPLVRTVTTEPPITLATAAPTASPTTTRPARPTTITTMDHRHRDHGHCFEVFAPVWPNRGMRVY